MKFISMLLEAEVRGAQDNDLPPQGIVPSEYDRRKAKNILHSAYYILSVFFTHSFWLDKSYPAYQRKHFLTVGTIHCTKGHYTDTRLYYIM